MTSIILEESKTRHPLHSRRMELLRIQKTSSHSDYLYSLEQYAELIDFKSLTKEALIIHLFLEQADMDRHG